MFYRRKDGKLWVRYSPRGRWEIVTQEMLRELMHAAERESEQEASTGQSV